MLFDSRPAGRLGPAVSPVVSYAIFSHNSRFSEPLRLRSCYGVRAAGAAGATPFRVCTGNGQAFRV